MQATNKTGPEGVALIKKWEQLAKKRHDGMIGAYNDGEGVATIGWGSTQGITMASVKTIPECEAMLEAEIAHVDAAMATHIHVPLEQHQWDALSSFFFNVGVGWLGIGRHPAATFVTRLNGGDYACVPSQLARFARGANSGQVYKGLADRRKDEGLLWLKAEPLPAPPADAEPHPRAVRQDNPDATIHDVRAAGSAKVTQMDQQQTTAVVVGGTAIAHEVGMAGAGLPDPSIVLNHIQDGVTSVNGAVDLIKQLEHLAVSPTFLIVAACLAAYWFAHRVKGRTLLDFIEGRSVPSGMGGQ